MHIEELENYSKRYPNITVEELIENIKKEKKQALVDDETRKENEKKWFEDLIGKYILIDFNDKSYVVFYCDKSIMSSFYDTKFECFNIHRTSKGFDLSKEKRGINYLWFNCPYTNQFGCDSAKITFITEEKYNQIAEIYNTMESRLKAWF